ncbi:NADH-ubiquinone oxidoreductase B12 subunit [Balamuthia mandrillaris]
MDPHNSTGSFLGDYRKFYQENLQRVLGSKPSTPPLPDWRRAVRATFGQAPLVDPTPPPVAEADLKRPFGGANEAWRKHPLINPGSRSMWAFLPGLRPAILIFGAYVVGESIYYSLKGDKSSSHSAHH